MIQEKYPRTYHWITSPGVSNDDKILKNTEQFLNIPVTISEKLDGGNCSLNMNQVSARAVGPTSHPSFDYIKAKHAWKSLLWKPDIVVYGENVYARHSLFYDKLTDYFYVFGIKQNDVWFSWEDVKLFCLEYDLNHVPTIAENIRFKTEQEITKFFVEHLKQPSFFGAEREGFVMRNSESFSDFTTNICKYVRANHVNTDERWEKTWIPNIMIGN